MVTNAEKEPEEPSKAATGLRVLIAGHPQGALRRIGLYIVACGMLVWSARDGDAIMAVIGIIAILLLAITDPDA